MRWVLIICAALLLVGCGEQPPPRGSAQDQAAGAGARAESTVQAADAAAVDAAAKRATAEDLERRAKEQPSLAAFQAAADARTEASVAQAIATALRNVADSAATDARTKAALAAQERQAEQDAQAFRAWQRLCRMVGLAAVIAGCLVGALIGYLTRSPSSAALAGGALLLTGCIVIAFGPATVWLPWAVPAAGVLAAAVWAIAHQRTTGVALALSHTVDALECKTRATLSDAKKSLHTAVERSGMRERFTTVRNGWKDAP